MKKKQSLILTEVEGIQILKKFGISYPVHGFAKSEQEAVDIANKIGFPVVMKVVSPDITHKTDVGGVRIGLDDEKAVHDCYVDMLNHITATASQAAVAGFLVCRQANPGLEVIIGTKCDPVFGPTLMFGLGGVFTEVLDDVSFRVLPLRKIDAQEMIREIKGFPVIAGRRNKPGYDIEGLVELIFDVSQMVKEVQNIMEMDLNPVLVYDRGNVVVDVRIVQHR
jgi:acetyl-CoA synthetase (ADP-forming)